MAPSFNLPEALWCDVSCQKKWSSARTQQPWRVTWSRRDPPGAQWGWAEKAPENPPVVMGTVASGYDIHSLPWKDPPFFSSVKPVMTNIASYIERSTIFSMA